ncbi:MAG: acyl carrier protein [Parabacteroides sp.]|nr:acyl carrier protein [Parabacteroides sp.]
MKGLIAEIASMVKEFGSAPTFKEMPRKTLADKGIAGPTAAHTIEEVHTPLNLAYLTFTTGSSAFQNIVGITFAEMAMRKKASTTVLEKAGLKSGDRVLVTYPPLVNVFSGEAFKNYGLEWQFLVRSSRDAFLAALYEFKPKAVVGESSFIRAALEDAKNMGVVDELPKNIILLTAGTPLDLELLPVAKAILNAEVHDLYGCQEFGWLCMDGVPVRDDLELIKQTENSGQEFYELVVGGLPMGDSFPKSDSGHVCNPDGKIITYRRERTYPEYEVIVKATTLTSKITLGRVARSILRIKGRVVKISPDVITGADHTVLELRPDYITGGFKEGFIIEGPDKTKFFDDMVQAQLDYQQKAKADPTWNKTR